MSRLVVIDSCGIGTDFNTERFADNLAMIGIAPVSAGLAAKSLYGALLHFDVDWIHTDHLRVAAIEIVRAGGAPDFDRVAKFLLRRGGGRLPKPTLIHTRVMQLVQNNPFAIIRNLGVENAGVRPSTSEMLMTVMGLELSDNDSNMLHHAVDMVSTFEEEDVKIPGAVKEKIEAIDSSLEEAESVSDVITLLSVFPLTGEDISTGLGGSVLYALYMLIEGSRFGIYGPDARADQEEKDQHTFGGSGLYYTAPPTPPPIQGFDWSRLGKKDVKGAITVGVSAGVITLAGGAVAGAGAGAITGAGIGGIAGGAAGLGSGPGAGAGAIVGGIGGAVVGGVAGGIGGAASSIGPAMGATALGAVGGAVSFLWQTLSDS